MAIIVFICFLFAVTTSTCADALSKREDKVQTGVTIQQDGNVIGVSSVAGVTSNNGKVSSISDVKFYAPPGTSISQRGDTMSFKYPMNGNGIATGFVQMGPGSVVASSSTYNPDVPQINWRLENPYNYIPSWQNDLVLRPPIIDQAYIDPWFNRYLESFELKPSFRSGWPYPGVDYLNLWR